MNDFLGLGILLTLIYMIEANPILGALICWMILLGILDDAPLVSVKLIREEKEE